MYSIALKVSDCIRPDALNDMLNLIGEATRGTDVVFEPMSYDLAKVKDMEQEVMLGTFEYSDDEAFTSFLEVIDFEISAGFGCSFVALLGESVFELEADDTIYLIDDLGEVAWEDE